MALYDRLMGKDAVSPKIGIHAFSWSMGEYARGKVTSAQAQAIIASASGGVALTAAEVTELTTLLGTITGTVTVKLARAKEIEDVIGLAEQGVAPYNTSAVVETRLGV